VSPQIKLTRPVIVLLCLVRLAAGADLSASHVRNFARVNDHLFRGGEPSLVGLQELGAMGVKIDIDLRGSGEGVEAEKQAAEKLGMKYVNIPLGQFSAPTNEQMERVLSLLLRNDSETTFVHCRRGKDRTSTVIACYRIQHDGWDNNRALVEAKQHGMSFVERGMHAYILHFTPLTLPANPLSAEVAH
jgi:tyrosine-protein phosphatase SIW14